MPATRKLGRRYQQLDWPTHRRPYNWFDFSDYSTMQLGAGATVLRMDDKMKTGIYVVGGGGAPGGTPPLANRIVNGRRCVDYSGGQKLTPGNTSFRVVINQMTWFMVGCEDTDANGNEGFISWCKAGENDWEGANSTQSSFPSNSGQDLVFQGAALGATGSTTPTVWSGRSSFGTATMWKGAAQTTASGPGSGAGVATMGYVFGGRYLPTLGSGSNFDGWQGEFYNFNYPLTDAECRGMWQLLKDRWRV